jgi:hypothetical protein
VKVVALVLVLALSACPDRRSVSIFTNDPNIRVDVDTQGGDHSAEVKVSFDRSRGIVPLLIVPVPVPYARGAALAEKP